MTIQATWNGQIIAESDQTRVVEGNHYFPPDAVKWEFFEDSPRHTFCPWKGTASYYDIVVDGQRNPGGAWYYPDASDAAKLIENYVAFWQGVRVERR
jgi:uncharacterized protein (DUF427 family)